MRSNDPQITHSQTWVKVTNESQGTVKFYPFEEINSPAELMERFVAIKAEYVTGFGVRAGHSDIFEWEVYQTQLEADEAFEFHADGRVYSSEAA